MHLRSLLSRCRNGRASLWLTSLTLSLLLLTAFAQLPASAAPATSDGQPISSRPGPRVSSQRQAVLDRAYYWFNQPNYYTQDLRYRTGVLDPSRGQYGFDCSGYVYKVFSDTGNLNLISKSSFIGDEMGNGQAFWNPNPDAPLPGGVQPGDLVFFGDGVNQHDHVGIIVSLGSTLKSTLILNATTWGYPILKQSIGYIMGAAGLSVSMINHFGQLDGGNPAYTAQILGQNWGETTLPRGATTNWQLSVNNAGTATWQRDNTQYPVRLGTANPGNHHNTFCNEGAGGWLAGSNCGRVVMEQATVAPNNTASFTVPLQVPATLGDGDYTESFQLLSENNTWFGPTINFTIHVRGGADPNVGAGSSRQAQFQDAYYRAGGAAVMGPIYNSTYWWNGIVRQEFNWNYSAGRGNAIMQDENQENNNGLAPGTCRAYYTLDGIGTHYEWFGNMGTYGAPTSDPYWVNGTHRQSFAKGYIQEAGSSYKDDITVYWSDVATTGWRREFYNDPDLSCSGPSYIDSEPNLNFNHDWGMNSPEPAVFNTHWSARYTRTETLSPGVYSIQAGADDGVKVWIDSNLVINNWQSQAYTANSWTGQISAGTHTLTIAYFQDGGPARLSFSLNKIVQTATSTVDHGSQSDANTPGTLSYALKNATYGNAVTIDPSVRTIKVLGQLPPVPAGVKLTGGSCTNPVVLDGSQAPAGTIGLQLNGLNTIEGIKVIKFSGQPLKILNTGNHFTCSSFGK